MQPQRSLGKRFSRLGRLENAWAEALSQPDPSRALDQLREIFGRFESIGRSASGLWLPFQASVLGARFVPLLADADFRRIVELGGKFAGADGIGIGQAWWPVAQILLTRAMADDYERAHVLLTWLYRSPLAVDGDRVHAAAALARTGAVSDEHLAVYADLMARHIQPPPEVTELVDAVLRVGFDDDDGRLRRAFTLAGLLTTTSRQPATAFALGLGELLIHRRPAAAAGHFRTALRVATVGAEQVQRGLIAAYLHARDFAAAAAAASPALGPRSAELLLLARMLAWLDVRGLTARSSPDADRRPATAAQLAGIASGRDAGIWYDYALGCAYLLDGDAAPATALLAPLPAAGLRDPEVYYYAAWAHLLCQGTEDVRACYHALAGQPGEWALGCLLVDAHADPEPAGARPSIPAGLDAVAAARQKLADGSSDLELVHWDALDLADTTSPDRLEALRTALGAAATLEQTDALAALTRQALFARLPAAERLLWAALVVRPRDPARGRALLEQAHSLGRDRAALLLAVDLLKAGRPAEVRALLRDAQSPKAELLRAWADLDSGAAQAAATRFTRLSERRLVQADYALGLMALRDAAGSWASGGADETQARAQNAIRYLTEVTARGYAPCDIATLLRAARALNVAGGQGTVTLRWADATAQPWTARLLALAQLVRAPEAAELALLQALTAWQRLGVGNAGTAPQAATHILLADVMVRACALVEDTSVCEGATALLADLADHEPLPQLRQAARRAVECADIRLRSQVPEEVEDPLLALAGAEAALAAGDRTEAARRLRALRVGSADPAQLGHTAVSLLAAALVGQRLPAAVPVEAPPAVAAAIDVVNAAGLCAVDETRAAEALLRALRTHDISELIDVRRVLLRLCARAAAGGRRSGGADVLVPLVRRAASSVGEPGALSAHVAARCATVAGDYETANALWHRAVTEASDLDERQQHATEHGRLLCHRAVAAHLADDRPNVLVHLRASADLIPEPVGQILADLEEDDLVSGLLSRLFPDSPIHAWQRPGRYPQLATIVGASRGLRQALDGSAREKINSGWVSATAKRGRDVELWHTVAVLCREDALSRAAGADGSTQARITATAIWMLLLAEPALNDLLENHGLAAGDDASFHQEIADELLGEHKARSTEALALGDVKTAQAHLDCLDAVRGGLATTRRLLADGHLTSIADLAGTEAGFAPLAARADGLLKEWGAERIAGARRLLEDPAAISRLPSGIDRDYESAIKDVEVVLGLRAAPLAVFSTALEWHNKWLFCLYQTKRRDSMRSVLQSAARFADVLLSLCTPGRAHLQENQALGQYWVYWAFVVLEDDPEQGIAHLERAREWDAQNASIPGLLSDANDMLMEKRWQRSKKLLDRNDVAGAEQLMRDFPAGPRMVAGELNRRALAKIDAVMKTFELHGARNMPISPQTRVSMRPILAEAAWFLGHAARIVPTEPAIRENLEFVQKLRKTLGLL